MPSPLSLLSGPHVLETTGGLLHLPPPNLDHDQLSFVFPFLGPCRARRGSNWEYAKSSSYLVPCGKAIWEGLLVRSARAHGPTTL